MADLDDFQKELDITKNCEVYTRVVERFWKVREKATGFSDAKYTHDKAAILLQDTDDFWHCGEGIEGLCSQLNHANTSLKSKIAEETFARKQAEGAAFLFKQKLCYVAGLLKSELQQMRSANASLKQDMTVYVEREQEWILLLSEFLQHQWEKVSSCSPEDKSILIADDERVDEFLDIPEHEEGGHGVDMEPTIHEPTFHEFVSKDNETISRDSPLEECDDKVALAQALQEKVAALLLLSQQEERQFVAASANLALESQIATLKQQLTQVTNEKVSALVDLARLQEECTKMHHQEKNFEQELHQAYSFSSGGLSPPVRGDGWACTEYGSDTDGKSSIQGYLKQLGSRSKSLSHMFSLSKSKDHETVGNFRLHAENVTLRESLSRIRHLCKSAYRLRLTIAKVAAGVNAQTDSSIQDTVQAVDGVISEALHLKVAIHNSLPGNDLGWNSIGFSEDEGPHLFEEGSYGDVIDNNLDIVSFFGLEIVRLVLLAAQMQKRFLGQSI